MYQISQPYKQFNPSTAEAKHNFKKAAIVNKEDILQNTPLPFKREIIALYNDTAKKT